MSQISKIVQIKYPIAPSIFRNKNLKNIISDDVKKIYTNYIYENEYIMEVINVYTDYIKNPLIDPISGNMMLEINVKCKCLKVKNDDELEIDVIKIINKGIMGTCCEDIIHVLITDNNLKEWKFNDAQRCWEKNTQKIFIGSKINVKILEHRFEKNMIRCFAKLI